MRPQRTPRVPVADRPTASPRDRRRCFSVALFGCPKVEGMTAHSYRGRAPRTSRQLLAHARAHIEDGPAGVAVGEPPGGVRTCSTSAATRAMNESMSSSSSGSSLGRPAGLGHQRSRRVAPQAGDLIASRARRGRSRQASRRPRRSTPRATWRSTRRGTRCPARPAVNRPPTPDLADSTPPAARRPAGARPGRRGLRTARTRSPAARSCPRGPCLAMLGPRGRPVDASGSVLLPRRCPRVSPRASAASRAAASCSRPRRCVPTTCEARPSRTSTRVPDEGHRQCPSACRRGSTG